jgi:aldehyde dehydrogenase (NAD+)
LVEASAYERVLAAVGERISALKVGAASMDLDVGPLIRANQLERVNGFLTNAASSGLRVVAQGQIAANAPATGFYAKPTLIADVPVDASLACDEVFGPVLAAMPFKDEADAVRLANATEYGLVAGVWTENGARGMRMAQAVKSGQVFINNYGAGGGVELPFGGVKSSGYGREKGFEALYGFSVMKTVVVKHG